MAETRQLHRAWAILLFSFWLPLVFQLRLAGIFRVSVRSDFCESTIHLCRAGIFPRRQRNSGRLTRLREEFYLRLSFRLSIKRVVSHNFAVLMKLNETLIAKTSSGRCQS